MLATLKQDDEDAAEVKAAFIERGSVVPVSKDSLAATGMQDMSRLLDPLKYSAKDVKQAVSRAICSEPTGLHKVLKGVCGKHVLKAAQESITVGTKDSNCGIELQTTDTNLSAHKVNVSDMNASIKFLSKTLVSFRAIPVEASRIFIADNEAPINGAMVKFMKLVTLLRDSLKASWSANLQTWLNINTRKRTPPSKEVIFETLTGVANSSGFDDAIKAFNDKVAKLVALLDEVMTMKNLSPDIAEALSGEITRAGSFHGEVKQLGGVATAWAELFRAVRGSWRLPLVTDVLVKFPGYFGEESAKSV